ncbi:MAG: hypothetical protein HUK40_12500 [Desulfobacter sp.]|nr:hypothetical protein [Desulfobacter sp.]
MGAIADIRDVTLKKQMESLMIRVDKLTSLGVLSAGIAHEIRNPLAGMKACCQVLARKITQGKQQVLIAGILNEIDRLNTIVTDLVTFSGSTPHYPGPADIGGILEKTLGLLKDTIKKAGIEVIQPHTGEGPPAFADREQVQQIFLNIILNAVNAMPDGGKLTISLKTVPEDRLKRKKGKGESPQAKGSTQNGLEITFTDTGSGIKKKDLDLVFNPFFTTSPKGSGLGLSIVHKLVENNKGVIFITSTHGQGTRVTLILPAADPAALRRNMTKPDKRTS